MGGQWPMILSGGISVLARGWFIAGAAAADPTLTNAIAYAIPGAVFFLVSRSGWAARPPETDTHNPHERRPRLRAGHRRTGRRRLPVAAPDSGGYSSPPAGASRERATIFACRWPSRSTAGRSACRSWNR